MIRCTVSCFAVIVLSITSFVENTCSVVDLFALYAACDGGISASNRSLILLVMQAASILRNEESRMIGLRFEGGPFG